MELLAFSFFLGLCREKLIRLDIPEHLIPILKMYTAGTKHLLTTESLHRLQGSPVQRPGISLGSYGSSQWTDELHSVDEYHTVDPAVAFVTRLTNCAAILPREVMKTAISFLPFADILSCREVSSDFHQAASAVVWSPMPGALFLRFPHDSHRGRKFTEDPPHDALRYTCKGCKTHNNVTLARCRRCGERNKDNHTMRRVFMGQLRKVGTTEHLEWLLASLFPTMNPFHIEAHTTKDGRNKGCAWVYVTNASDEDYVLSIDGRLYLDQLHGIEGVWIVGPSGRVLLNDLAIAQVEQGHRGGSALPRQPVVSELPASSKNNRLDLTAMGATGKKEIPKPRSATVAFDDPVPTVVPIDEEPPVPCVRGLSMTPPPPGCRRVGRYSYARDPYSMKVLDDGMQCCH